ncbi:nitrous oxide reductase accessory protein NosL [Thermomicrobium sp. 4228-Ro]|uniref:nitrous oxide reductase accessory protein NosL n=1 Tax=Thermomicrobium sp. 4228-Ro TaxID=2993937 RepID=UPI0022488DAA|nr:nitrous oxide reductase accessory protein NosL [Thermomicrobium sp. 4228-Ro]MCX2728195.1 nitrous oxide reductase accessory protein NosL [Thermomicrobium sp. 4228-Ro]
MTRRAFLALALAHLAAAACRKRGELTPPDIRYGRDTCAECGMIISDPRFAAAAAAAKGDAVLFDDIGCLLRYREKQPPQWVAVWVHDYETEAWLNAERAWYLVSPALRSPMGYGIAAFSSVDAARSREAALNGALLSWNDLSQHPIERPR